MLNMSVNIYSQKPINSYRRDKKQSNISIKIIEQFISICKYKQLFA